MAEIEPWRAPDDLHAPITMSDECEALKLFIEEVTTARSGSPPWPLPEKSQEGAEPPSEPPRSLVINANALGHALTRENWARLDDDERYALMKLGAAAEPSHNFRAALEELIAAIR